MPHSHSVVLTKLNKKEKFGTPQKPLRLNLHELIASVCKKSFFEFVKEFWKELITDEPVWNWHIEFLCNELQEAAERVFANLPKEHDYIINIPPGTTKSTICSIMYPAWILTRMPHAQIICGSHTDTLVLDLSNKCRQVVESEKYSLCFPSIKIRDDQNTKGYWRTTKGGFRFSCTVGGKTPTGFHGHFLIVDDPIDPMKVLSEGELKAANDWMGGTLSSRKVNNLVTVSLLIMQRLHQDDPTGNRLAKKDAGDIRHICLPAEKDDGVKPKYLGSRYVDGLLDPIRLPHSVLKEKMADMGQFRYSGQYRQNPVPLGGGMFKVAKINFGTQPPRKEFKKLVRYWDNAATSGAGAYTVGVLMGLDKDGRYWVLDVVRGQWESFEREKMKKSTAVRDGKTVIIGLEEEGGSGGKDTARWSIRSLAGWRVRTQRPTGDKILRADPFATQVNGGNVWIPCVGHELPAWVRPYLEEFTYFPASKFKDQVDASSGAFSLCSERTVSLGVL